MTLIGSWTPGHRRRTNRLADMRRAGEFDQRLVRGGACAISPPPWISSAKCARPVWWWAPPKPTASLRAPTSRNSWESGPRRTVTHWCAPGSACSISWSICPAPASPPCTDSHSAAAWSSPSPAAIESAPTMRNCLWGLPEVLLGIHPGFGGTVRAVRLMGVRPALELMLKGRPFKGARALAVGLLDELVAPAELKTVAKRLLLQPPAVKSAPFVEKLLNLDPVRPFVARKTAAALRAKVPREHYPAPYAIRRTVAALRRRRRGELRSRGAIDRNAHVHSDVAQSGAGVPAAGQAQRTRRQAASRFSARACHRSRCHGRRYRGVGGTARLERHAAGPQRRIDRNRRWRAPRRTSRSA